MSSYVQIWRVGPLGREKIKYRSHEVRMRFHIQEKETHDNMVQEEHKKEGSFEKEYRF